MPVTAKFGADFAAFERAVQQANVSLKGFQSEAGKVGASLNRMVDNFSGRKVISDATLMTEAVDRIGGVSKLTATELQRVGAQAAEAAAKMRALGLDVPERLDAIAASAKKTTGVFGDLGREILKTAAGFATGQAILDLAKKALTGLFDAAKGAIEFASQLDDMSKATNISTDTLQELGFAGKRVGIDMQEMGDLVGQLSKRIATMDPATTGAVQSLSRFGISLASIRQQRPEEQFIQLVEAIGKISDPLAQAGLGSELFGRRFQSVMKLGADGLRETMAQAKAMGAVLDKDAIQSLDAFGDAMGDLTGRIKVLTASALTPLIQQLNLMLGIAKEAKLATFIDPKEEENFKKLGVAVGGAGTALAGLGLQLKVTGEAAKRLAEGNETNVTSMTLFKDRLAALTKEYAGLTAEQKANIVVADKAGASDQEIAAALSLSVSTIRRYLQATKDAGEANKKLTEEAKKLREELDKQQWDEVTTSISESEQATLDAAKAIGAGMLPMLKSMRDQLGITALESKGFVGQIALIPDRSAAAAAGLKVLETETKTLGKTFQDAFGKLPDLFINAFTGGGGISGALKAFGTSITQDLFGAGGAFSGVTKAVSGMFGAGGIGGAIGSALGGILPGIGALIGPAIEGIKKLFRSAEQEINPLRKAFVDAAGGLDQLRNKATAAGVTINALLSAKNAKQYEAAIKALNSAFEEHERDITRAKELMSEYGITIQETGQKWRDQQLNEQIKGLINDYRIMVDVLGLSVPAATEKMAEKFNTFLATAQQVGFVVPAEMKPILEQMIKLGLLTDDQGNKYESLEDTGVTFAETFAESVDRLVDKFDEFLQRLGLIPAAINAIPDRTIRINYDVGNPPNIPAPPPSGAPSSAGYGAVGGLVTSRGIQSFAGGGVVLPFRPRGRDTVPAMLTPGETVDQPGVKDAVVRELQSLRSELPRTIARAVRDEVQKVRRT